MNRRMTWRERGTGPPLVFLHGVGGDAACWQPQLAAFADRFRAIAWNMPGYGGSDPLEPMTFAGLAEALGAFLDQLGIGRAHLVGHSMGGMVAQEFVLTHSERVRSLALVATSAAFGRADAAWQKAFLEQRLGPLEAGRSIAELAVDVVTGLVGDNADAGAVEQAIRSMAQVPEATYRDAIRCLVTFDRREALAAIPAPTLLIAGEQDRVAPPQLMEKMAARIPDARLVVLPHAGHLANLEQPARFNHVLAGFLDNLEDEA